jgi:NitT/TauT family transport system substrate-binding protein
MTGFRKIVVRAVPLLLLLAGCTGGNQSATQSGQTTEPTAPVQSAGEAKTAVTIAQFGHVFLYMPLYVAIQKGMFARHGLDVKLVSTGGDEKTFTAVATGNAQFGVSDPTFTAIAREHGQSGKVVAAVVRGVPFWVVTFNSKLGPFTKPQQFQGLRCASFTAPSTSYAVMKKILDQGHADKAQIVQGAFGTLPALLKSGQADVAIEIEPTVSIVTGEGGHVVYSPQKKLGDFAFTGLEVSSSYAKEHPDIVRGCVAALAEAMHYIHDDFDGAVAVATKEFPEVKPEVVKDALSRLRQSHTIPTDPLLPKSAWDAAIALRRELGDLKGAGSYAENVDMSFLIKGKGEGGK